MKKKYTHFSFFHSHLSFRKGFTLMEMLTVISILGIIGLIVVSVITIALRTSKKTDLLEVARQNGDSALSQMVKSIRYAQSLDAPTSCVPTTTVNSVTITSLSDHLQTTYACTGGTIASNGASLVDNTSITVSACSFVCVQPTVNDPPTVTIQYTLQSKNASSFAETNFSIPFQSSVTLRNVQ